MAQNDQPFGDTTFGGGFGGISFTYVAGDVIELESLVTDFIELPYDRLPYTRPENWE